MKPADMLAMHLAAAGIGFAREFKFHKTRKWRLDFALIPIRKNDISWREQIAVEVEGGLFVRGRHSRGSGMEADMEKYAEAAILGWTVLRVSPRHVKDGRALTWVERCLEARK